MKLNDGSTFTALFQPDGYVWDMVFYDSKLYWTTQSGLHRSDANGNNRTTLRAHNFTLCGVDVDDAHIYWGCLGNGNLRRSDLNGSNTEILLELGENEMGYPRLDYKGKVYWSTFYYNSSGSVFRANLDGTDMETIVSDTNAFGTGYLYMELGERSCYPLYPFGDLVSPYGADFNDIARVVSCFVGDRVGSPYDVCDLFPCTNSGFTQCLGDGVVDFNDIAQSVAAFVAWPGEPVCR